MNSGRTIVVEPDRGDTVVVRPKSPGGGEAAGLGLLVLVIGLFVGMAECGGGSQCGRGEAPAGHPNWDEYSCQSQDDFGAGWRAQCLRRAQYSNTKGEGCPGQDRCCPSR